MDSSAIVLVEALVILVIVLGIGIQQLWSLRRPPKDRPSRREADRD